MSGLALATHVHADEARDGVTVEAAIPARALGIDPGISGAIAILTDAGDLVTIHDMPILADGAKSKTKGKRRNSVSAPLLRDLIASTGATQAFLEDVHAQPRDGAAGHGRIERERIAQEARDEAALWRVQETTARRLAAIGRLKSAVSRARALGELIDWLSDEETRAILSRAGALVGSKPKKTPRMVPVPAWVPDELAEAYREDTRKLGEVEAARIARGMKREMGT